MTQLNSNDLESISAAILSLHTQKGVEEFPASVLKVVQSLLPCEHCSYNEIERLTKAVRCVIQPHVAEMFTMFPVFQAHFAEHPYWKHHNGTTAKRVHKTTDFMSLSRFEQSGIYREFYRHLDTRVQMYLFFDGVTKDQEIGIAINRMTEFSERDRQVLQLLRPHISQAATNAVAFTRARQRETALEQSLGSLNRGMVELNPDGRIIWMTPKAVQLMETYFPGSMKHPEQLPEPLEVWAKNARTQISSLSSLPRPFCITKEHSRLQVVSQFKEAGGFFLLLSEEQDLVQSAAIQRIGLTPRELEVTHWITEGKTNPEIATILEAIS